MSKSTLIDLKPEMATRRKQARTFAWHRERLNMLTPRPGDAIVRSHTNNKYENLAEMTRFSSSSVVLNAKLLITKGNLKIFGCLNRIKSGIPL